ncbi:MAG: NUDIX domain-containing protein [Candidatus Woesearchaeota archaeon]|nr:NUDIX domain-containing protein [Candidatus Woesearchaeota archaeon]
MGRIPHDPNEIIAVMDDEDRIIGRTTRKEAHEKGLLHREAYAYLINSKKQVLLQRRADNHLWDHSVGGHFPLEQDYLEGALREFREELGINLDEREFKEIAKDRIRITSHNGKNVRFVKVFLITKNIPMKEFNTDKEEVEEIKYFDISELKELLKHPEEMTDTARYLIEKYVLKEIQ